MAPLQYSLPMKTMHLPLFAAIVLLSLVAPTVAQADAPAVEKIYVSIDYSDPLHFERMRLAQAGGAELILSTLKASAAEQARFANYPGEVVVLDEKDKAPDGAKGLLLYWSAGNVTATLLQGGKEKYLGVVSRAPLSDHPDYIRMRQEIQKNGLRAEHRDAELIAATKMNLYQALKYLVIAQQKAAKD
jgi:hypothetical protein